MLADSIVTTHTSTLPNAICCQDGLWYLPLVSRSSEGGNMIATVHVYASNADGSRGEWSQCLYGQGATIDALVASVFETGDIAEDAEYALNEVAIACLCD